MLLLRCACVWLLFVELLCANITTCPIKLRLEVLPGRGWDNLRNKDMGQVLQLTYDQCKTTDDGMYLIPDHVSTIPVKESSMDLTSELIEHYSNYTSLTAHSFRAEATASYYSASRAASVSGSFSTGYQNIKKRQVNDHSMTTRIQVRSTVYSVLAEPTSEVHDNLKQLMMDAAHELENNNTEKAQLMVELIVRDYGTHYLSNIDAGAVLVQEDYIASQFVENLSGKRTKLGAAASASFLGKFSFGVSYEQTTDNELLQAYKNSTTSSSVRSIGGAPVEPNMSVHDWLAKTANNLVAVDRSGEPLSYIITPQKFPDITLQTLGKLRDLMEGAIDDYYSWNTHAGCMNMDSDNFEYNANFNDHSCHHSFNNYTFGGVYQTCKVLTKDAGDSICDAIAQPNILTSSYSCPTGYKSVALHTAQKTMPGKVKDCSPVCFSSWLSIVTLCASPEVCPEVKRDVTIEYSTSWCYATGEVSANQGLMFGGLFTSLTQNPLTSSLTCPNTYVHLHAGFDMNVCVSSDYELGSQYSVPFGGFFSCSQGNPLTLIMKDKSDSNVYRSPQNPYPLGCPGGYSQHTATIDSNCEIFYCVKADAFRGHGMMPVVRPPFRNPAHLFANISTQMLSMPASSTASHYELNTGALAGVIIGSCVLIIVVAVIVMFVVKRRRQNRRDNQENNVREPLISEGPEYGTINGSEGNEA